MRHTARLRKLEERARKVIRTPEPHYPDEEEWFEAFEESGRHGIFRHEPDFARATAFLRDAIATAKAQDSPPFEPPLDFRSDEPRWRRLECWRTKYRFPDVVAGLKWLQEMRARLNDGTPPVSEAEFDELVVWYRANEERLLDLQKSAGRHWLEVEGRDRVACSDIRYHLMYGGARSENAGKTAVLMRKLRDRYSEVPPPATDLT